MSVYPLNTLIRLYTAKPFADANGTPTDPTSITLGIRDPHGNVSQVTTTVRDSTGVYHYDLTPTISGIWTYTWEGTGTVQASSIDAAFTVQPSSVVAG